MQPCHWTDNHHSLWWNNVTCILASSAEIENDYLKKKRKKKPCWNDIYFPTILFNFFLIILMHYCSLNLFTDLTTSSVTAPI